MRRLLPLLLAVSACGESEPATPIPSASIDDLGTFQTIDATPSGFPSFPDVSAAPDAPAVVTPDVKPPPVDTPPVDTPPPPLDTSPPDVGPPPPNPKWDFDAVAVGAIPADFSKVLGTWAVAVEGTSPSKPNALRQTADLGANEYPRVVAGGPTYHNLSARVRCRPESGFKDQSCGLMVRVQPMNDDSYYVARASALEQNVRLYRVLNGDRQQIGTAPASVDAGVWHTLVVTAIESAISVSWDGDELVSVTDTSYASGRVGLWTRADSVTAFDDLEIFPK